jgi:hypothetical protein
MKRILSLLFTLTVAGVMMCLLLSPTATAKILFEDNFKNAEKSKNNWVFAVGDWKVQGGKLTQGAVQGRSMAYMSDAAWPEEYDTKETALTQYIFEVTVKKLRGDNGALVFWRIRDDMKVQVGRECGDGFNSSFCLGEAGAKGRLEDIGKGRIKLWWDLGREGAKSVLVRDVNGIAKDVAASESKHKLSKNKEHRIRIENDTKFVKMFIDDELVWEGKEINGANKGGRIGLGTHATAVEFSDFVITDLKGQGVEPGGKITTTWGSLKTR